MLAHLAYVSVRKSNCTEKEIEVILNACKKNNPPLAVTGVLLYSDNKFIQYVEGESTTLMTLYDKIKKDDRHDKVIMLSYGPITSKIFPSWHMANKKFTTGEVNYRTDIDTNDKMVFGKILNGEKEDGMKIQNLLVKFFKN